MEHGQVAGRRPLRAALHSLEMQILRLGATGAARAVRDSMVWLTPYLMILSTLLLLVQVSSVLGLPAAVTRYFEAAASALRIALPLVVWGATGAMRALQWQLSRTAVAFVCVACGVMCELLLDAAGVAAKAFSIPLALLLPLQLVPLLKWLSAWRWTRLSDPDTAAGENVGESINLIVPSLLGVAVTVGGVAMLLALLGAVRLDLPAAPDWLQARAAALDMPLLSGLVYAVGNSLLWLLGVHGYYTLLPLLEQIPAATAGVDSVVNQSFMGLFVFMGGSGATLSLVIALVFFTRVRRHRILALASVAPALINVNELLLFGLPLIFNRWLAPPFVLVPVANLLLAYAATRLGLVPVLTADLPFNSPLFVNAMLASGGQAAALLMQVGGLLLGAAVYAPFLRRWERAMQPTDTDDAQALGTLFSERLEDTALRLADPIGRYSDMHIDRLVLMRRLALFEGQQFAVHFQPQVEPVSGVLVGCEALMRMQDAHGGTVLPGEFLGALEKASRMVEVDVWVLSRVAEQVVQWRAQMPVGFRVAVNISPCTLSEPRALERIVAIASRLRQRLVLEITEHTFLGDEAGVAAAFQRIRATGASIHIDDFGTGYSSLSYLHRFPVDGVKIDKSFTDTLGSELGCQVFRGVCSLAETLRLEVVVEGVEQAWQLRQLPLQERLTVQGWLYSKALPPPEFSALLSEGRRFLVRPQDVAVHHLNPAQTVQVEP